MKLRTAAVALLAGLIGWAAGALAYVKYEDLRPKLTRKIVYTGFLDYAPFGWMDHPERKARGYFHTMFDQLMEDFKKENNLKLEYKTNLPKYEDLVQAVRRGEIDMILGAYFDTDLYKGLELVYPAIINNPITVFMLPHRVKEVQSTEDLRKLKGARSGKEYYTDFVEEQIKNYPIEKIDDSYTLFERLFTGKIDYIVGSQFFVLIEASRLGLRNQVAIARQTVWSMPLFIGVSKISEHRRMIIQKLTHYSENPENKKKLEQHLIDLMIKIERENQGVVPPTFGLEKAPAHLTAAQRRQQKKAETAEAAKPEKTKEQPAETSEDLTKTKQPLE